MKTSPHTPASILTEAATFIGIDYHKKYSVWHAVSGVHVPVAMSLILPVHLQRQDR